MTFFSSFPKYLVNARSIADDNVRRALIAGKGQSLQLQHSEYSKLWTALHYHYTYWQQTDTLRSLLHELQNQKCDYDAALFTKMASFAPSLSPAPVMPANPQRKKKRNKLTNDSSSVAFRPASHEPPHTSQKSPSVDEWKFPELRFVDGFAGTGEAWFHLPPFRDRDSIFNSNKNKRKNTSDNNTRPAKKANTNEAAGLVPAGIPHVQARSPTLLSRSPPHSPAMEQVVDPPSLFISVVPSPMPEAGPELVCNLLMTAINLIRF